MILNSNADTTLIALKEKTFSEQDLIVDVLLTITIQHLEQRVFSYRVPDIWRNTVTIGQPVLVPFGTQTGVTGFVVAIQSGNSAHTNLAPGKIKPVTEILDTTPLFDTAYYEFACWVANYYATTVSQVLACALPANLVQKPKKLIVPGPDFNTPYKRARIKDSIAPIALKLFHFFEEKADTVGNTSQSGYSPRYLAGIVRCKTQVFNRAVSHLQELSIISVQTDLSLRTKPKMVQTVFPVLSPSQADKHASQAVLTNRQKQILDYLNRYQEGVLLATVLAELKTTTATLKKLAASQHLSIEETPLLRNPTAYFTQVFKERKTLDLSKLQQTVVQSVLTADNKTPFLIYGVTGSGKTEVYMSLTRESLLNNQSVLIMVPEIALTSQIARRFIQYFGAENLAIWHSNLSDGEKADTWAQLQSGQLRIVIGARSAIWAPIQNVGMIIIDEEHETSYKQDAPVPRYNAKTLALELSKRTGAKLVLGSATPEISSYYLAQEQNRILTMTERFGGSSLANVELVDMKKEREQRGRGQLSQALKEALQENLESGNQSIVLLNRRGFYTLIQCLSCDYTFYCPNCEVALTYHRTKDKVCCHYCGFESRLPQYCPVCTSMELVNSGVGTQRIEAEIARLLPDARLLRLDSDILKRKHAYLEIFEAFSSGEADILIGTQVVAKGLDVANVTLVGVINADASFALPDYKSAERGFQLLTQVAGRAGRGKKEGRVIVQSCQLEHMVLKHSQNQDYLSFYEEEVQQREQMGFPPFSQLFRLVVTSENDKKALQYISTAVLHLKETIKHQSTLVISILGPAPCVLPKIQKRYRYHVLLKNFSGQAGHQIISSFYQSLMTGYRPEDISCLLDVDAYSLL